MNDKTKSITPETFVPLGEGWFNYYQDADDPSKYYKQPCPGLIYMDGDWVATTLDDGYLMSAIDSSNYLRTGRGNDWVEVDKSEAEL